MCKVGRRAALDVPMAESMGEESEKDVQPRKLVCAAAGGAHLFHHA